MRKECKERDKSRWDIDISNTSTACEEVGTGREMERARERGGDGWTHVVRPR